MDGSASFRWKILESNSFSGMRLPAYEPGSSDLFLKDAYGHHTISFYQGTCSGAFSNSSSDFCYNDPGLSFRLSNFLCHGSRSNCKLSFEKTQSEKDKCHVISLISRI